MSDFVNPTTTDLRLSVNDMPAPWVECTRAQYEAWSAIPQRYRKWVTDHIEEMTQAEKDAVDAALLIASRDAAVARLDSIEDTMRAFAQVMAYGFNAHTARINGILDAIDAGATIGAIKTSVASINNLPTYNMAGLRDAIRAKLGT